MPPARSTRAQESLGTLAPVLVPAGLAAALLVGGALWALVEAPPDPAGWAWLVGLLLAASLAEAYPVPLPRVPVGGVSLAAVFIVSAAVILGWEVAALVGGIASAAVQLRERKPALRIATNTAVYVIAGATAGAAASTFAPPPGPGAEAVSALAAAAAFFAVNIVLVAAAVGCVRGTGPTALLLPTARWTALPFAIMALTSAMLVALAERSAVLALTLAGPLVAITLYQRLFNDALQAMELAVTDELTGLRNRRGFHDELRSRLADASWARPLTVCLLDLDDLKRLNDQLGHAAGDGAITVVASALRQLDEGEGFRIGGDEFALLLPGLGEQGGAAVASRLVASLGRSSGGAIGVSVGVASYPAVGLAREHLLEAADAALYEAKHAGKGRVCRSSELDSRAAALAGRAQALQRGLAAGELTHADRVAVLAAEVGARLGLARAQLDLLRVAGSLHDIGKLGLPHALFTKPGALDAGERQVVARHPELSASAAEALGLETIADWIRYHHERWDGVGYPSGLAGSRIPLPARILAVVDAFDAMTSDRPYRLAMATEDALAELDRTAGSQFDPDVVAALAAYVREPDHAEPSAPALARVA